MASSKQAPCLQKAGGRRWPTKTALISLLKSSQISASQASLFATLDVFQFWANRPTAITEAHPLARLNTKAVCCTALMMRSGQSIKLNLPRFIRFSGSLSSTKIPRSAQQATNAMIGSARGAAKANSATSTAIVQSDTCQSQIEQHHASTRYTRYRYSVYTGEREKEERERERERRKVKASPRTNNPDSSRFKAHRCTP